MTGGKKCRRGRFTRPQDDDCRAKVDLKSQELGSTEPFESVFGVPGSLGDVFGTFNDNLRDVGYENGKTLFGAAYDFRRVSEHYMNTEYGPKLKTLIEEVYEMNDRKKVLLLGHSMGTAVITLFLNSGESLGFDQAWKDKYIHAFHMVAPANGGAPMALMGVTAGVNPTIACDGATDSYWTFAWKMGLIQLMPNPRAYGDRKTWQASAAEGAESHTASTQGDLLDSGPKRAAYKDVGLPLHKKFLDDPGVKTILYYNSGLPTPNTLDASTGKLGCDGFGDGTVPTHASTYMQEHWGDVISVDYKDTCGRVCKHREMMQSECLFKDVTQINHGLAHGKTPQFAANNVCSYEDGTPCGNLANSLGQKSCFKCRNPATIWHGYGKVTGFRCGTQPCWEKGHKCVPFISCRTCCGGPRAGTTGLTFSTPSTPSASSVGRECPATCRCARLPANSRTAAAGARDCRSLCKLCENILPSQITSASARRTNNANAAPIANAKPSSESSPTRRTWRSPNSPRSPHSCTCHPAPSHRSRLIAVFGSASPLPLMTLYGMPSTARIPELSQPECVTTRTRSPGWRSAIAFSAATARACVDERLSPPGGA